MLKYYEDDMFEIYHGDSLNILPQLDIYDLLVTDPPYGQKFKSNRANNHSHIVGDESTDIGNKVIKLSSNHIKSNRHAYVFGNFQLMSPWTAQCQLIWDKVNIGAGNLSLPWGPQHEIIQFGVYVPSKSNRDRGDGRLSARLRKGSVLRCIRKNSRGSKLHPSEKPVDILRQLIESSSMLGETVFDPFMGVGSTLVAARIEGRRGVGIEIEEKYCEIASRRLEEIKEA